MNLTFLVHFTREEPLKYLGHLDMQRLWQRSLRRAQLPLVYSQGFNPHIRFSLAVPLAVGMTSSAEYLELELEKKVPAKEIQDILSGCMPEGLRVLEVRLSPYREALGAKAALLEYEVGFNSAAAQDVIKQKVNELKDASMIKIIKTKKSGTKEIDIRPGISSLELKGRAQGDSFQPVLTMKLTVSPNGSVTPNDVLQALEIKPETVSIHRKALYFVTEKGEYYTP